MLCVAACVYPALCFVLPDVALCNVVTPDVTPSATAGVAEGVFSAAVALSVPIDFSKLAINPSRKESSTSRAFENTVWPLALKDISGFIVCNRCNIASISRYSASVDAKS